jgi:hypothetical protein
MTPTSGTKVQVVQSHQTLIGGLDQTVSPDTHGGAQLTHRTLIGGSVRKRIQVEMKIHDLTISYNGFTLQRSELLEPKWLANPMT